MDDIEATLRRIADAEGGETFMQWPDRWWEHHTFRCLYGHVSTMTLKSTPLMRNVCIACYSNGQGSGPDHDWTMHLTFPEDCDGPLAEPVPWTPGGGGETDG